MVKAKAFFRFKDSASKPQPASSAGGAIEKVLALDNVYIWIYSAEFFQGLCVRCGFANVGYSLFPNSLSNWAKYICRLVCQESSKQLNIRFWNNADQEVRVMHHNKAAHAACFAGWTRTSYACARPWRQR